MDGCEMDLETSLKETVGRQMGTFLSCVPGKLAYFEDEDGRYHSPALKLKQRRLRVRHVPCDWAGR
jgi:hypothetical protein